MESLRFTNPSFQRLFNRSVGFLLRKGEFRRPTGATYWIAGALVTILIYPKKIAIFAVVMLTVSDAFAAGVGKSVGKIKIKAHKTVEGSLAFFLSAFLIGRVFLGFSNPLSVFGAFVGAVLELRLIPVNDNLMVPIGSGFLLVLFQFFVK
ncbi:MAG TPA: hypothetical protein ENH53_01935 [Bacteroidetes bacterium]|nr:hypothetical protein [Bacteroidota bacterium]